jgi:molybdate transport system permease protein
VAGPFYIRSARAGFESVNPQLERVAATLGESDSGIFWRITVPLAFPSLLGGAVMTWARALGEFGATIMFAGNFPGRTQTMPLAVYMAMESDLWAALTLALLLVVLSFGALIVLRVTVHGTEKALHAP